MEDQVEFVTHEVMQGKGLVADLDEKALKEQADKMRNASIQEQRRNLPVYPYKEAFLQVLRGRRR